MKLKPSIIFYVFAVIGSLLLAAALYLYQDKQAFFKKAEVVQGTVTELLRSRSDKSIMYRPVVEFETKSGKKAEFTSSVASNPASYNVGEKVEVLYDPVNPAKADINGFSALYLGPLILGIIGTVFILISFISILFRHLKQKKTKYLLDNGKRIVTKFENVQLNSDIKVNNRNPFLICSRWLNPNTNELHIFKSEDIWFDPTEFIKTEEIKVIIDPNDPKKYLMDTSFLPNLSR